MGVRVARSARTQAQAGEGESACSQKTKGWGVFLHNALSFAGDVPARAGAREFLVVQELSEIGGLAVTGERAVWALQIPEGIMQQAR
ncbi:hypothetical protein HNR46_001944 [Haloferula luteola]|uniref:Uncharacterized protein n=1 Tax=Haloferula luteola TaxID=595692 RepID=A0A840V135_9BACT|nr:hypothetical protein [Haloferula luteola]